MNLPVVYLIRKRALGDVLWIEPLIRQLAGKRKKVIVYTKFNVLFENYPLQNVHFKQSLSFWEKAILRIESFLHTRILFINLEKTYEKNPRIHFLHAYQLKAGLPETNEYPVLYFSYRETQLKLIPDKKYAVVHLESLTDKNYRKVFGVHWDGIVNYLNSIGISVIQIGREDTPIPGAKYVATNIREMMIVIRDATLFIGIDSGPSHIAASLGVPSLIFFGAVNPDFRHFRNQFRGFFLQQFCEFAGCYHSVLTGDGPDCRLVGKTGIPKCSLHTSEYVITQIDMLIKDYRINDN